MLNNDDDDFLIATHHSIAKDGRCQPVGLLILVDSRKLTKVRTIINPAQACCGFGCCLIASTAQGEKRRGNSERSTER